MSINELFNPETNETKNARALSGTAELTRISNSMARNIIRSMEEDIDVYRERIAKSANDNKELDELINEFKPWPEIDEDNILNNLDDTTVESMLKSQQSKRSRCKGKTMTLDNYANLMTAAIAENMLREIYNKPKSAAFGNRRNGTIDYTPAELERLADDQEALRKEIRNIQSKKSIAKSKADFDESSEYYQALLKYERMLKDLRVGTTAVEVDTTKNKLQELLGDTDIEHLKAADSKELLSKIMGMLNGEDHAEA